MRRRLAAILVELALALAATSCAADGPRQGLVPLPLKSLCVTEGALISRPESDSLTVEGNAMRAVATWASSPAAELQFLYRGPTPTAKTLGSGRVRHQVGLKLRAQDPCNVVYVMWRFDPPAGIFVQIKQNAGQSSSAECGNAGYRTISPTTAAPTPAVLLGTQHSVRAEMHAEALQVWADGTVVWEGTVAGSLDMTGPIGLRSDNGLFDVTLFGAPPAEPVATSTCTRTEAE